MELYITADQEGAADTLALVDEEYHHLRHVLRKSVGQEIHVTNGVGIMYRVVIDRIDPRQIHCRILERLPEYNEPARKVTLVQAILRQPARMDWIIEKGTELGVHRFIPVVTERTLVKKGKTDRWNHIARSAVKQCFRSRIPEISEMMILEEALLRGRHARMLFCHEEAERRFSAVHASEEWAASDETWIFVGPEGGFSTREVESAERHGAVTLKLGSRRLRSETAAISVLSCLDIMQQAVQNTTF